MIDASAGVDLLLDTVSGRALLARLPSRARWWAPEHYLVEVGAALDLFAPGQGSHYFEEHELLVVLAELSALLRGSMPGPQATTEPNERDSRIGEA